jgi:hypothetical protein
MELSQGNSLYSYLKQKWHFFSFTKSEYRRAEQVLWWWERVGASGRGKKVGKGCRRVNIVQYCVHMYVNGKKWDCSRKEERGDKGEWSRGVNSSMIYLIYCKNFCKCHTVSPPSTKKQNKQTNKKKKTHN